MLLARYVEGQLRDLPPLDDYSDFCSQLSLSINDPNTSKVYILHQLLNDLMIAIYRVKYQKDFFMALTPGEQTEVI